MRNIAPALAVSVFVSFAAGSALAATGGGTALFGSITLVDLKPGDGVTPWIKLSDSLLAEPVFREDHGFDDQGHRIDAELAAITYDGYTVSPNTRVQFSLSVSSFAQALAHESALGQGSATVSYGLGLPDLNHAQYQTLDSSLGSFSTTLQPFDLHDAKSTNFTFATGAGGGWFQQFTLTRSATTTIAAVPEPETYALMLAGLGVVGWGARRRSLSQTRQLPQPPVV